MRLRNHITALVVALGVIAPLAFLGVASADTSDDQMTATWNCCGAGGAAAQDFLITSSGGALSGTAKLPGGTTFARITGSRGGTAVTITTTYTALSPGYVATFTGTLSPDVSAITGTWSDSRGQRGTFTATRSAPFMDPLPVPEASRQVSRVKSLQGPDGTPRRVAGTVTRDGRTYPLTPDSVLQIGDVVHTDANSLGLLEFGIGGRVGMNRNATVRIAGERSVEDLTSGSRTTTSFTPGSGSRRSDPLEIQTNGGVLSSLRG